MGLPRMTCRQIAAVAWLLLVVAGLAAPAAVGGL